jgi:hypothetical protein
VTGERGARGAPRVSLAPSEQYAAKETR